MEQYILFSEIKLFSIVKFYEKVIQISDVYISFHIFIKNEATC